MINGRPRSVEAGSEDFVRAVPRVQATIILAAGLVAWALYLYGAEQARALASRDLPESVCVRRLEVSKDLFVKDPAKQFAPLAFDLHRSGPTESRPTCVIRDPANKPCNLLLSYQSLSRAPPAAGAFAMNPGDFSVYICPQELKREEAHWGLRLGTMGCSADLVTVNPEEGGMVTVLTAIGGDVPAFRGWFVAFLSGDPPLPGGRHAEIGMDWPRAGAIRLSDSQGDIRWTAPAEKRQR